MSLPTPNTRKEQYLNAIATGNSGGLPTPITREEEYLDAIAKSGGGSGEGDMKKSVYDSDLDVANAGGIKAFVNSAVAGKVDKVEGKGLSTNDYDDTEKEQNATNTSAIEAIENVTGAKNVLKYPYTNSTNTQGGLTFTDNGDGTVTVSGSETTGANVYFALENNISVTLGTKVSDIFPTAGNYTISCKNADGTNIYMSVYIADVGSFDYISEDGTDVEITNAMMSKTLRIHLEVKHDYVLSSAVTLKPMIRPEGTDSTYVPYAMPNRELTDGLNNLTSVHGLLYDTDLNNITEAGLYILATGNTNKPDNMADWSGMLCCTDSESGFQLVFSRSGYMYWRFQVSGNWENWVYINHV